MPNFIHAAWEGDLVEVQRQLADGEAVVTERDFKGRSALIMSAYRGHFPLVKWLVEEGGASINEADDQGMTALLASAIKGHLANLKWLLAYGGARITDVNATGMSALLCAAAAGKCATMAWLLKEGGANFTDTSMMPENRGKFTVWSILETDKTDDAELSSLLKTMALMADAPPEFVGRLKPQHAIIATQGKHLRRRLPAYLETQRTQLALNCPLPSVLQPIIAGYAEPTRDDIWQDRLTIWSVQCWNPACEASGSMVCKKCKQARYCGRQCQA